jgi:hypothetical protein
MFPLSTTRPFQLLSASLSQDLLIHIKFGNTLARLLEIIHSGRDLPFSLGFLAMFLVYQPSNPMELVSKSGLCRTMRTANSRQIAHCSVISHSCIAQSFKCRTFMPLSLPFTTLSEFTLARSFEDATYYASQSRDLYAMLEEM